jgi:hypothetical protein
MRWAVIGIVVLLAGCGGGGQAARPTRSPAPTEVSAPPSAGPRRAPLACPASSSRAQLPDRVLALGGDHTVTLAGEKPELEDRGAGGRVLARTPLPARAAVSARVLACARDGRLAVAWTEQRGERMALRVALRADGAAALGPAQTVATRPQVYDDDPIYDVELAFAPDGELLVVYSMLQQVRAVTLSPAGELGTEVRLGHASQVADVVAEIAGDGRAVVAWSTVDSGEARDVHRHVYAATRAPGGLFAPEQLVHRAPAVIPDGVTTGEQASIRLAVAPDGRAVLLWGAEAAGYPHPRYAVLTAQATARGRFGPARRLARDGYPIDAVPRADGTARVTWRAGGELRAAIRGAA